MILCFMVKYGEFTRTKRRVKRVFLQYKRKATYKSKSNMLERHTSDYALFSWALPSSNMDVTYQNETPHLSFLHILL